MTAKNRKVIIAGVAGNVMEWYDFAVYGYFAVIIGKHFFPSDDPTTSIIASFGAFAAGFMMRPVGSMLFGHLGDKLGRKKALTLSVMMMAIPTFLIGFLPDHSQIGISAAVMLVVLRMLQGISVGGEYTTSIAFLAENSPPEHRGFMASWSVWGAILGILLGSGVGALVSNTLSDSQIYEWGWRLPFLGGVLIGIVGIYIRRHIMEPDVTVERPASPLLETVRFHKMVLLRISGLVMVFAASFYLVFVYAATWLHQTVHISKARALDINTLNIALLLIIVPLAGWLSDRIGRKPLIITGISGLVLFSYPLFQMMHHNSDTMIFLGQFGFVILIGTIQGVIPAALTEMAPARVRISVMSLGYNLPFAVFGGTAPLVSAYLIKATHVDLAPAIYLSCIALISLLVAFTIRETAREAL